MAILKKIRKAIEKNGIMLLRISVGIVFLWFGFLKYFGNFSPAEDLASRTISFLTFGYMESEISMPLLATIECIIGLGIITKKHMKYVIPLLYFQMAGAILPLFLFTSETWQSFFVPSLEGQYIIKNAVLITAAIVLDATAKGGELITDPQIAQKAKAEEERKAV